MDGGPVGLGIPAVAGRNLTGPFGVAATRNDENQDTARAQDRGRPTCERSATPDCGAIRPARAERRGLPGFSARVVDERQR